MLLTHIEDQWTNLVRIIYYGPGRKPTEITIFWKRARSFCKKCHESKWCQNVLVATSFDQVCNARKVPQFSRFFTHRSWPVKGVNNQATSKAYISSASGLPKHPCSTHNPIVGTSKFGKLMNTCRLMLTTNACSCRFLTNLGSSANTYKHLTFLRSQIIQHWVFYSNKSKYCTSFVAFLHQWHQVNLYHITVRGQFMLHNLKNSPSFAARPSTAKTVFFIQQWSPHFPTPSRPGQKASPSKSWRIA